MSDTEYLRDPKVLDDESARELIIKAFPFHNATVEGTKIGAGNVYIRQSDIIIMPASLDQCPGLKLTYPSASVRGTCDPSADLQEGHVEFYCQIDLGNKKASSFIKVAEESDASSDHESANSLEMFLMMDAMQCKEMFNLWNEQDVLNPDMSEQLQEMHEDGDEPQWFTADNIDQMHPN